jgi:hypothetical protein
MNAPTIAIVEMTDGQRVAVPLIPILKSMPPAVREGVARRNLINTLGRSHVGRRGSYLPSSTRAA